MTALLEAEKLLNGIGIRVSEGHETIKSCAKLKYYTKDIM